MRRFFACAAVLAVVWFAPVCGRADDQLIAQTIAQKIEQKKASGDLRGFTVDLQVTDGTVELSGSVSSPDHRDTIIDIARRVRGVKKVVNGLNVTASPREAQADVPRTDVPRTDVPRADVPRTERSMAGSRGGVVAEVSQAIQKAITRRDVNQVSGALPLTAAEQAPRDVAVRPSTQTASRTSSEAYQAMQSTAMSAARPAAYGDPTPAVGTAVRAAQPAQFPTASPSYQRGMSAVRPVHGQAPVAFAPATPTGYQGEMSGGGIEAMPAATYMGGGGAPVIAHYDHPQMPNHAWPSYAPYPNYGAVTYPRQYSPTVWPYIGPFYPYPQVPLGWRKVTLEWDDGWWMLDFKSK